MATLIFPTYMHLYNVNAWQCAMLVSAFILWWWYI